MTGAGALLAPLGAEFRLAAVGAFALAWLLHDRRVSEVDVPHNPTGRRRVTGCRLPWAPPAAKHEAPFARRRVSSIRNPDRSSRRWGKPPRSAVCRRRSPASSPLRRCRFPSPPPCLGPHRPNCRPNPAMCCRSMLTPSTFQSMCPTTFPSPARKHRALWPASSLSRPQVLLCFLAPARSTYRARYRLMRPRSSARKAARPPP